MGIKKKYAILGASGHIGRALVEKLLAEGQEVRGIARSADHLKFLAQKGGQAFGTSFADSAALTKIFEGVDGVFTMIPPDMANPDYRRFQAEAGAAIAQALRKSGVNHVVNLSSVGAHLVEGTGPILGLHHQEERLNQINDCHCVHLRPAYFMENTLFLMDGIRSRGVAAGELRADLRIPMIATKDIAFRAAELFLRLDFTGKSTRELLGERDLSYGEVIPILGRSIGKPDLPYLQVPYKDLEAAFQRMGLPAKSAELMIELARGLNEGFIKPEQARSKENTTPTSIEEFAKDFAAAYHGEPSS